MKRILTPLAAAFCAFAPMAQADDAAHHVTVVTSGDAQTQLMSMVLTSQAMAQGRAVQIMLCGPAGDIALKDAPESATKGQPPKDISPQALLKMMIEKGAKAEVCAIYLPGKNAATDALIDGVTVAAPPAMAKAMLSKDATVWSF